MHKCPHIHIHIRSHEHMYKHAHSHACTHTHTYIHRHIRMHAHSHSLPCTYVQASSLARTHACTHTHTDPRVHMLTHTGAPPLLSEPFHCGTLVPGEDTHILLPLCKVAAPPPSSAPAQRSPDPPQPPPHTQQYQSTSRATISQVCDADNSQLWTAAYPVAHQLLSGACRGGGAQDAPDPASNPSPQTPSAQHKQQQQQLQQGHSRPFLMRAARQSPNPLSRSAPSAKLGAAAGGDGGDHCVCVVVNMRLVARSSMPGCWALVLGSLGGQPPHLLHNASPVALEYHEASLRCVHASRVDECVCACVLCG